MKRKNWFWGIFLILAAVLVIASQFVSFANIGVWSILGGLASLALLVSCLVQRNFGGALFGLALLYIIFQKPLGLFYLSPWILIVAAILFGIGLDMLFRRKPKHRHHREALPAAGEGSADENADDNHPYARVSFGSMSKYLHADQLEYGEFHASFGELEVFFDQATPAPGGVELFLECSFGAIKLYVPRSWQIVDNLSRTLAGVENDTRFAANTEASPQLLLTGNVTLGAVEVQYV